MADKGNGNGKLSIEELATQTAAQALIVRLGDLQRDDGILVKAADKAGGQQAGILQTVLHSHDDGDYRSSFRHARWKNDEQRDKYVKAHRMCIVTGAVNGQKLVLDLIDAQAAGENGALMHEVMGTVGHISVTSRQEYPKKGGMFSGFRNNNNSGPTIAD